MSTNLTNEYNKDALPAGTQCSRSVERIFNTIKESGMDLSKTLIYLKGDRVTVFGTPTVEEELNDEDPTFYNTLVDLIIAGAPEDTLLRAAKLINEALEIYKE